MTHALYYENAYQTEFAAKVLACQETDGVYHVSLDRTCFYPTGGGQPHDTGKLNQAVVRDVWKDDDNVIWHCTDAPLPVGKEVFGRIDWARRFDHMQQHGGQHLLSWAIREQLGGYTVGLHTGAEISSIDVIPDETHPFEPTPEALAALENAVQDVLFRDLPTRCFFPTPQELATLPLRKPPAVTENIRIVATEGVDYTPCGGLHPSSTGQTGLLKIVECKKNRGKWRFFFLCGKRAYRDYQLRMLEGDRARALLSSPPGELPEHIAHVLAQLQQAQAVAAEAQRAVLQHTLDASLQTAESLPLGRLVHACLAGLTPLALRDAIVPLLQKERLLVLAAAPQEDFSYLIFARSADLAVDMGALLKTSVLPLGGKGGGKPDFAQGSVPGTDVPPLALETARRLLSAI